MVLRSLAPIIALAFSIVVPAASASAQGFETKAEQAFLMDDASGLVLFEKNADQLMHPASMSKLMTLDLVFRALKEGRLTLESEFTVSENAWRKGGAPSGTSAMFAPLNTQVTLADLIPGITVQSGNDASIIIAEGMSGSEDAFAREMEAEARRIGLRKSTFRNATGLTDPEHLMTARELALLANHMIDTYPDYYHYFGMREFQYRKHKFHNRNPLVFADIGVDGLKTGFVSASGYGLTASAKRGDQRLIVVVNGLKTEKEREAEARKLLEWGFSSFKDYTLFDPGETVGEAWVWGGDTHSLPLVGKERVRILLPSEQEAKLRAHVVYDGPLKAPIRKGDQVAMLRVAAENGATNEIPLFAGQDVAQSNFMSRGLDSLVALAFGWML
jgi:D-alanyl-D-alanine carboxypeptidase (penicillin-binding protein 5/6)